MSVINKGEIERYIEKTLDFIQLLEEDLERYALINSDTSDKEDEIESHKYTVEIFKAAINKK